MNCRLKRVLALFVFVQGPFACVQNLQAQVETNPPVVTILASDPEASEIGPDPDHPITGAAPAPGRFPVALFVHGFSAHASNPYLQYWAAAGFIAVAIKFPLTNADAPGGPNLTDTVNESRWTCRCRHCAERFGGPVPAELTPEVQAFREASVADFLRDVVAHVASLGGRSTICLLPATAGTHGISDWNTVASLPGLTTFATDPYWKHWNESAEPFVRRFARLLNETSRSSTPRSRPRGRRASTTCGPGATRRAVT